jgi:site-specific recombinase XerD
MLYVAPVSPAHIEFVPSFGKDIANAVHSLDTGSQRLDSTEVLLGSPSVFETAKRWSLISVNPFRGVQKPKVPEVQPAYLTQADCEELFKVIDDRDFSVFNPTSGQGSTNGS